MQTTAIKPVNQQGTMSLQWSIDIQYLQGIQRSMSLFNLWYAMQVPGCLDTWMHIHLIGMTFQLHPKPP